ncbi:MAG: hypothetical protein WDO71_20835 [Bacteroidota bacterium]
MNDELGALKEMLEQTPKLLSPGGRADHYYVPFS